MQLEQSSKDNVTIGWIRSMLHHDRAKRIADSHLMDDIFSHQDEHVYYGPCCAEQGDAEASSNVSSPLQESPNDALLRADVEPYFASSHNISSVTEEGGGDATAVSREAITAVSPPTPIVNSPRTNKAEGDFNPNPPNSGAVQAVDRLLGPRRVQSGFGGARSGPTFNRVDALWQPAYLSAYNMSLRERRGYDPEPTYESNYDPYGRPIAPLTTANGSDVTVNVEQSREPQVGSVASEFNAPPNPAPNVPQLPSWEQVMGYTGISRCKGAW